MIDQHSVNIKLLLHYDRSAFKGLNETRVWRKQIKYVVEEQNTRWWTNLTPCAYSWEQSVFCFTVIKVQFTPMSKYIRTSQEFKNAIDTKETRMGTR